MFDYTIPNKMIKFCETLKIPEGSHIGEPIVLLEWQKDFIKNVFKTKDGKRVCKMGILAISRKNGKTAFNSLLILQMMVLKGLAKKNAQLYSGASSRDQAALIFNLMTKIIAFSPLLQSKLKIIESKKMIINMSNGCTFQALAADGGLSLGKSSYVYLHDETAVAGCDTRFIDAMESSQGAYEDGLILHLSTISSNDESYFNQLVDKYKDNHDPQTYCAYYCVPQDAENIFDDIEVMRLGNPSLGHFLSVDNMLKAAKEAKTMTSKRASFMNYNLNMRINADNAFIQADDWRAVKTDFDYSDYYGKPAICSLDLSVGRYDLCSMTIIVRAAQDDYKVLQYTFSAKDSLEENATRLKIDLKGLAADKKNHLYLTPGITFNWNYLATQFISILKNFDVVTLGCDPYKVADLEREFEEQGYSVPVEKLKQSFPFFNGYIAAFQDMLYNKTISHEGNFFSGYGLNNSILVENGEGDNKIFKKSENSKIDPAVSLCMSCYLAQRDLTNYDDEAISYAFV